MKFGGVSTLFFDSCIGLVRAGETALGQFAPTVSTRFAKKRSSKALGGCFGEYEFGRGVKVWLSDRFDR